MFCLAEAPNNWLAGSPPGGLRPLIPLKSGGYAESLRPPSGRSVPVDPLIVKNRAKRAW
jgi:hypothetical protein